MQRRPIALLMSLALFIGCGLLISACANLAPEQPRTLMRDVAEQCADQAQDIDVHDVTLYGRLVFGYGETGQLYREGFLTCYREGVHQAIRSYMAVGHLASSAAVGAQTTVPLTLVGDTMLVPVMMTAPSKSPSCWVLRLARPS